MCQDFCMSRPQVSARMHGFFVQRCGDNPLNEVLFCVVACSDDESVCTIACGGRNFAELNSFKFWSNLDDFDSVGIISCVTWRSQDVNGIWI
ncbi:hypothetical protein HMPREF3147_01980 [Corynebacterium sp. HMSC05D03]|nr:hypothetical protein HMPREF3147_01980 [Corynebacterium sp. HMSC05D03]